MPTKRIGAAVLMLAGSFALAGCGGASTAAPTPEATTTASPSSEPTQTPSATPTPTATSNPYPTAETISCDTMLDPAVDAELRAAGLFNAPKEFTMLRFSPTLPSIECPWGEEGYFHAIAYFTWAQLAPGERDTVLLLAGQAGMSPQQMGDGRVWLTYGSDAPPDTPGIMLTDEWMAAALTPEEIADIVWTR